MRLTKLLLAIGIIVACLAPPAARAACNYKIQYINNSGEDLKFAWTKYKISTWQEVKGNMQIGSGNKQQEKIHNIGACGRFKFKFKWKCKDTDDIDYSYDTYFTDWYQRQEGYSNARIEVTFNDCVGGITEREDNE